MLGSSFKTLLVLAVTLVAACSSLTEQARNFARAQGMRSEVITGTPFSHQVFRKAGQTGERLHIYIEGDGRPWLQGHFVSDDPTPAQPLALQLMARSPYNAIYIGRPCYFGTAQQAPCEPKLWTSARYSKRVVSSLASVIEQLRGDQPKLLLIGYSGGGALATLLAQRLPGDIKLLTIASNLDTSAWTELHGYWPLSESQNPIDELMPETTSHTHLAGGRDTNVPIHIIRAFSDKHGGTVREFPDYDHVCCWRENWPDILNNVL